MKLYFKKKDRQPKKNESVIHYITRMLPSVIIAGLVIVPPIALFVEHIKNPAQSVYFDVGKTIYGETLCAIIGAIFGLYIFAIIKKRKYQNKTFEEKKE